MNSQIRNQYGVVFRGKQPGFDLISLADKNPPGDGERAVQPGGIDHSSIGFNVQAQITVRPLQLRLGLELEHGGIGMGSCDPEGTVVLKAADVKSKDAGPVAGNIIASAFFNVPCFSLPQPDKTGFLQHGGSAADGMEGSR